MSISRDYYVIVGYDLTGFATDKFEDWKWSDEGEKYLCYQRKGQIQLFDDPMSGDYLYLGYVFAKLDMYEAKTTKFNLNDVKMYEPYVYNKLRQLIDDGIIKSNNFEYEIIVFEECT